MAGIEEKVEFRTKYTLTSYLLEIAPMSNSLDIVVVVIIVVVDVVAVVVVVHVIAFDPRNLPLQFGLCWISNS